MRGASELLAAVGVGDGQREEADAEREENQIRHVSCLACVRLQPGRSRTELPNNECLEPSARRIKLP